MRLVSTALRFFIPGLLLIGSVGMTTELAQRQSAEVLFVCEHGNVKSLIAATLFNQAVQNRGLRIHSIARGIHPEAVVPIDIVSDLQNDGSDVGQFKPQALTQSDVSGARRVIAIGVDLGDFQISESTLIEHWTDIPAATIDYAASKAALLRHINVLLAELQTDGSK